MPARRTKASTLLPLRLLKSMYKQPQRTLRCPATPRLDGQTVLVTGGTGGIGLETCRGLLARGGEVILTGRSPAKTDEACRRLGAESASGTTTTTKSIRAVQLDLADLGSVKRCATELCASLGERRIDALVANAGMWPRRYATSPQGHEIAFATNLLGHFLLLQLLAQVLADSPRIVLVTGDIYIMVRDCTPDYHYRTSFGGMLAYCRSKLGMLWLGAELQARQPSWQVHVVHPGVVATRLGQEDRSAGQLAVRGPVLTPVQGAQTSIFCVTQPDLEPGGYYHNTCGLLELLPSDPARNEAKARALWRTCERLCASWL